MALAKCLRAFIFLFNFYSKAWIWSLEPPGPDFDGFGTVAESLHFPVQLLYQNLGFEGSGFQVQI